MRSTAWIAVLSAALVLDSCGGRQPPANPPIASMNLLDPDLVLSQLQGDLHLRIFPQGTDRCEASTGHILDASGARVNQGPDVDPVTPAVRCASSWVPTASNTARPVDECFNPSAPLSVSVLGTGTFIVLITGQGNIPLPQGGTQPGILGAGCTQLPLAPGQSQSITISMHEQLPMGVCGDSVLDFDETCDLGTAMNNGTSGCSANCQTVDQQVNTHMEADHHAPAVIWPTGQRLIVAWEVANVPNTSTLVEHIYARYFTAAGITETNPEALAVDVDLTAGPQPKTHVSLAGDTNGFVATWNNTQMPAGATGLEYEINAQAFDFNPPQDAHVTYSPGSDFQQAASIAVSSTMVVAAWSDLGSDGMTSTGIRLAAVPRAMPIAAPTASTVLSMDGGTGAAIAALTSGTFLVTWSATSQVWVQALTAMGIPQGAAASVAGMNSGTQDQPSIAALPDGSAVVAFRDSSGVGNDTSGTAIRWRVVNAAAVPQGSVNLANTTTMGDQQSPVVVAGSSPETMLIAWQDVPSGQIRGQLRNPDDTEVFNRINASTSDFQISDGTATGGGPRVLPAAALGGPNGTTFAITWEDDTSGSQIRMRVFPL